MTTHSPGTWRYNVGDGTVVSDQPAYPDDESLHLGYEGYVIAESVMSSNGPVLAAAPKLYRALKALLADCYDPERLHPIASEVERQVEDAIEAVEGRTS